MVKLGKLQKMCMDSEYGETDVRILQTKQKGQPLPLSTLCDMQAIYFLKKKEYFQGWYESKSDTVACNASGYFKVLRSLVTRALPFPLL